MKFESHIYDPAIEDELEVEVEVLSYSAGARATYYEPAEDAELELAVYHVGGGVNIWKTLPQQAQERLIEQAYGLLED